MSDDRPTRDTMSLEEVTISNMWEIAAAALRVRQPTLTDVLKDLVRKRWVTKRRSVTDTRVVQLRLSRRGHALALQIEAAGTPSECLIGRTGPKNPRHDPEGLPRIDPCAVFTPHLQYSQYASV